MSKELEEIAERLRRELRRGDYLLERGQTAFGLAIPLALAEAVTKPHALLREIAEDALNDGPINRGLNSVQAVLDYVAELDAREKGKP